MIKVLTTSLKEAFDYVKNCISHDESRPILQRIHMMQRDSELIIEAVDGFRLARTSVHIQELDGKSIPLEAIVDFFKVNVCYNYEMSELEIDDRFLKITSAISGEYESHRLTNGQFMKCDEVIHRENPTFTVNVNPQFLMDALKPYTKGPGKKSVELEFHGDMQAFFVTNGKGIQMILPLRR